MSDDNDDFFENFSTAPQDIAINPANVHYTNFLDDDNNTASASSKPIKVMTIPSKYLPCCLWLLSLHWGCIFGL